MTTWDKQMEISLSKSGGGTWFSTLFFDVQVSILFGFVFCDDHTMR
jgi:hypothetical protein